MSQKVFPLFLITLTACLFLSCTAKEQDANVAGVKHFYFEFVDEVQNDITTKIIKEVSKKMVQYDYIMSEASAAKGWPYYGTIERGSKVLKTEMMPPHTSAYRLSPISQLSTYNDGEQTLKLICTIKPINDSTINMFKESYSWHNNEWQSFAKKLGTQFKIDASNQQETIEKISKTIIRYTFK